MEMKKEQFKSLLDSFKYSSLIVTDSSDVEDILSFVHDLFEAEAEAIKANCPWATRSLDECETVIRCISFAMDDVLALADDVLEG